MFSEEGNMPESVQCQRQIDELLSLPRQIWLLGAGVSKDAGIPLMYPLTDRVGAKLEHDDKLFFQTIREELPEGAHVEHVLSHVGDLIAIADRIKNKTVEIGRVHRPLDYLTGLHGKIQRCIRETICWGYIPACGEDSERIGTKDAPIVDIHAHKAFVEALFHSRRAGLERRPPVAFFTTNYDTLLEDALALIRVACNDGFCGGAMAFWDPGKDFDQPFDVDGRIQARVYKLHGSIDWIADSEDLVVRRREGAGYPDELDTRLLIYPQATKYKVTQRDPFATLFGAFRSALNGSEPSLLAVCGYSFGDEHINEEIERAMKQRENRLTILAFACQDNLRILEPNRGLPTKLAQWLSLESEPWRKRIVVAGSHGIYHGSLENKCPCTETTSHSWWTFQGVTDLLRHGPEVEL
jgi:hypothetical protein